MKKLFLFAALGVLAAGCASSSNKTQAPQSEGLTDQYAKYQIVDQEFDNLVIPNDNYDRVAPYEDQVSGASYIQSNTRKAGKKPARKMTVQKTVVDGQGNPLPADASAAPVTDQEALPSELEDDLPPSDIAGAAN